MTNNVWCPRDGFWQSTIVCHLKCSRFKRCETIKKYEKERRKELLYREEEFCGGVIQLHFK